MKLATWNVNSIRARKDRAWDWLEDRAPDVVCMQETKVVDQDFPVLEAEERGYKVCFHGQKTYNGVAILSRSSQSDVVAGFNDGQPEEQARVLAATIDGIRVINVYVPNGREVGCDKYEYKLDWMKRLRAYLDRTCDPGQPVLLCGDFNVAPEDRDVYDPKRWEGLILCSDKERAALQNIVDWGFTDSFRMHHEDAGLHSWWDYRQLAFPKKRGLRIDMIYISQPLVARCSGAHIDREARKGKGPSDHAPVFVELEQLG